MKYINNKELKILHGVEVEILKEVDAFCKKNQITYFLYGGTLLGSGLLTRTYLNDSKEDAKRLVVLLKDIICRVDLIPANDSGDRRFKPSSLEQINKFVNILKENNIDASVRGTVGEDIKAACGQLRRKSL